MPAPRPTYLSVSLPVCRSLRGRRDTRHLSTTEVLKPSLTHACRAVLWDSMLPEGPRSPREPR